jgi:hypothetical protein
MHARLAPSSIDRWLRLITRARRCVRKAELLRRGGFGHNRSGGSIGAVAPQTGSLDPELRRMPAGYRSNAVGQSVSGPSRVREGIAWKVVDAVERRSSKIEVPRPQRKRPEPACASPGPFLASLSRARQSAAAEAGEAGAAAGTHPSPGSPSRPGTSASQEAAEAAEAAAAAAAEAGLPHRSCRSGLPGHCAS